MLSTYPHVVQALLVQAGVPVLGVLVNHALHHLVGVLAEVGATHILFN